MRILFFSILPFFVTAWNVSLIFEKKNWNWKKISKKFMNFETRRQAFTILFRLPAQFNLGFQANFYQSLGPILFRLPGRFYLGFWTDFIWAFRPISFRLLGHFYLGFQAGPIQALRLILFRLLGRSGSGFQAWFFQAFRLDFFRLSGQFNLGFWAESTCNLKFSILAHFGQKNSLSDWNTYPVEY